MCFPSSVMCFPSSVLCSPLSVLCFSSPSTVLNFVSTVFSSSVLYSSFLQYFVLLLQYCVKLRQYCVFLREYSAGIFKQSMGARNRVEIVFLNICNLFLGSLKSLKFRLSSTQQYLLSISGKLNALLCARGGGIEKILLTEYKYYGHFFLTEQSNLFLSVASRFFFLPL